MYDCSPINWVEPIYRTIIPKNIDIVGIRRDNNSPPSPIKNPNVKKRTKNPIPIVVIIKMELLNFVIKLISFPSDLFKYILR